MPQLVQLVRTNRRLTAVFEHPFGVLAAAAHRSDTRAGESHLGERRKDHEAIRIRRVLRRRITAGQGVVRIRQVVDGIRVVPHDAEIGAAHFIRASPWTVLDRERGAGVVVRNHAVWL